MCELVNCPHRPALCKIIPSSEVVANNFNVVLDRYYPDMCHVLQLDHGDIVVTDDFSDEYSGGGCIYEVVKSDNGKCNFIDLRSKNKLDKESDSDRN